MEHLAEGENVNSELTMVEGDSKNNVSDANPEVMVVGADTLNSQDTEPSNVVIENDTITSATEGSIKKKWKWAKHKCPFPTCSANVVHLPQHKQQCHKWAREDTVGVVNAFNFQRPKKRIRKTQF